jgi:hypothetical protein
MTTTPEKPAEAPSRDAAYWAQPIARLRAADLPPGAATYNIDGRRVVGPLQGFGRLWQKTYWVRLPGVDASPFTVIRVWKERFRDFWPITGRFYAPLTGIAPGEVAAIGLSVGRGLRLSTGVMVLYADDESFTFMCPEGHMFAGWITFSAYESEGATVAQVQVLIRPNDPIYEFGFRLFGSRQEDDFWRRALEALAAHFGVNSTADMVARCVDQKLQWGRLGNIRHNAAVHTALHALTAPIRWPRLLVRR